MKSMDEIKAGDTVQIGDKLYLAKDGDKQGQIAYVCLEEIIQKIVDLAEADSTQELGPA